MTTSDRHKSWYKRRSIERQDQVHTLRGYLRRYSEPVRTEVLRLTNFDDREVREPAMAWLRKQGLDPSLLLPILVLLHTDEGYELHASQYVATATSGRVLDVARDQAVSAPVVLNLGPTRAQVPSFLLQHLPAAARCRSRPHRHRR